MLEKASEAVLTITDPATGQTGRFMDTPANRVIAGNPWILTIQGSHPDPRINYQQTLALRYRATAQILATQGQAAPLAPAGQPAQAAGQAAAPASPGMSPADAAAFVQLGVQQQKREEANRILQGMNGGVTPTGQPAGEGDSGVFGPRPNSWSSMFRPIR